MSALAPLTDPSAGAGLSVTSSDPQAIPPPTSLVPANMRLSANPMLPAHPLGAYTDSQFEADDAVLRNQVAKQYADILQQLGYHDDAGNFIMGSVESEANKSQAQLQQQQALAAQGVTDDAQRNGTLFSGMRGTLQARAENPYVSQEADLAASTPLTIQKLYEQASGLTNDYVLQENQALAAAAQRAAAGITANPPGAGGGVAPGAAPTAGASVAGLGVDPGFNYNNWATTEPQGPSLTKVDPGLNFNAWSQTEPQQAGVDPALAQTAIRRIVPAGTAVAS